MTRKLITTVALAIASSLAASSGAAWAAPTCAAGCNDRHTTCVRDGGDELKCLSAWHQCKTSCTIPAKTVVRTTPVPAKPVKVAAVRP